ncbi:hypothetical protein CspHIS471_0105090 [Cutaneotrichosporon sp. HIS471]|nr:hypothetical protein CspHIS471_0105090 [Cutaneotrichosporon sp. HIS471]
MFQILVSVASVLVLNGLHAAAAPGGLVQRQSTGTVCEDGQTLCRFNQCVDLKITVYDCGECGNVCPDRARCGEGQCYCLSGGPMCPGNVPCPRLEYDHYNCGSCGNECSSTETCIDSKCTACPAGQNSCVNHDRDFPDNTLSRCFDLTSDLGNCGGCDQRCAAGATCDNGVCKCPPGQELCGGTIVGLPYQLGSCKKVLTDYTYCGGCFNYCFGECLNGQCRPCASGSRQCGNGCVNLQNDNHNCGDCYISCGQGSNCVNGKCGANDGCGSGQIRCSTGCTNPTNDNRHCGKCDSACEAGKTCRDSVCS